MNTKKSLKNMSPYQYEEHTKQFSSPKRLLIPLNLSAEEALRAVKANLRIGKK